MEYSKLSTPGMKLNSTEISNSPLCMDSDDNHVADDGTAARPIPKV